MAIHVTRPDGSVAGFADDKQEDADNYARSVNGVITHVSDNGEAEPADTSEQPLD